MLERSQSKEPRACRVLLAAAPGAKKGSRLFRQASPRPSTSTPLRSPQCPSSPGPPLSPKVQAVSDHGRNLGHTDKEKPCYPTAW